jgi:hypothetical protein
VHFAAAHAPYILVLALAGCGGSHGTARCVRRCDLQKAAGRRRDSEFSAQERQTRGQIGDQQDRRQPATLTTYFGPDEQPAGALPGEYAVTITKIDEPQGAFDPHKDPPPKNHLPLKYGTPQKSPLTAEVKSNGRNHFEFELAD